MKSLILIALMAMSTACYGAQVCWTDDEGYQHCEHVYQYEYPAKPKQTICWTDPANYTYCETQ